LVKGLLIRNRNIADLTPKVVSERRAVQTKVDSLLPKLFRRAGNPVLASKGVCLI
jgi:hypothetical protein